MNRRPATPQSGSRARFTLRQLEAFAATAQLGSVSAAALRLMRTQSAVSMALAELETALSVKLFERRGRRLVRTDAADQLLPHAIELTDRAREISAVVATPNAGPVTLALGASRTIGPFVMPALIRAARERSPTLRMRLTVANTGDLLRQLSDFALDCAFVEGNVLDPSLDRQSWLSDRLCLFARVDHPIFAQRGRIMQRLTDWEWVLREPGSGTREFFLRVMADVLPAPPAVALEVNDVATQKHIVRESQWLSCISRRALPAEPADEGLCEIRIPSALAGALTRSFWIVRNPLRFQSQAMKALLVAASGLRHESV